MRRARLSRKAGKMLMWKSNLKAVMDNPDYIEEKIMAISSELKKDNPNTDYLREKLTQMENWVNEIDLANKRAKELKK